MCIKEIEIRIIITLNTKPFISKHLNILPIRGNKGTTFFVMAAPSSLSLLVDYIFDNVER